MSHIDASIRVFVYFEDITILARKGINCSVRQISFIGWIGKQELLKLIGGCMDFSNNQLKNKTLGRGQGRLDEHGRRQRTFYHRISQ